MTGVLNATDAVITAENVPSIIKFQKPTLQVTSGLVGLYLIDNLNGAADNLINYADAGSPLTVIGSPVGGDFGVTLASSGGYETGILEAEAMTIACVFKPLLSAANLMVVAGGSTTAGSAMVLHCGTGSLRTGYRNGANNYIQVANSLSGTSEDDWVFGIGGYDAAGLHCGKSYNGTYNETLTGATGRTLSGATLRIGAGQWAGGYGNAWECAMVAIYSRKVDATERQQIAADFRAYYAQAGISTL